MCRHIIIIDFRLYGNGSSLSHEDPSTPSISTLNPSASAILLSGFETTPETGEVLVQVR